jgi:PAS domain S-box-containing protein
VSIEPIPGDAVSEERSDLTELLLRAEAILAERAARPAPPDHDDVTRIVHQLAVHQIELDLQEQELRQARDRLAESLARYVDLYDFAPAGYVTLDAAGTVTQLNLAGAELLGTERASALGLRLVELVSPHDREVFAHLVGHAAQTDGEHSCEVRLDVAGRPTVTVAVEARRAPEADHIRLAMVDVSELRAAQLAAVQHAVVAEREEIARMLHDTVQQRLFGLSSSLQALQMRPGLDAEVMARLDTLVDDLESTIISIRRTIFEQSAGWAVDESSRPSPGATG